jgi:hypothetical protein
MRRPALLVLVAVLACGTPSGQLAAQSLQPAADTTKSVADPLLSCVDAVNRNLMAKSEGAVAVGGVRVEGPPGKPRLLLGGARLGAGTSAGPGGMASPPGGMASPPDRALLESQNQALMDAAVKALQTVRAECAPNAPGEPVCVRRGDGRIGRCTLSTG